MIVDVEDVPKVAGVKWHLAWNGYALNRGGTQGKGVTVRAHRLIMNAPTGLDVDHINHDKLDNRKSNLRICTRSENLHNRLGAKWYYYSKSRNRWVVDAKYLGMRYRQFKTEQEAKVFVDTLKAKEVIYQLDVTNGRG